MAAFQIVFWLIVTAIIAFSILVLIWTLAKNNLFWTIVIEGQARGVLINGKFCCFHMSYENKIFAREDIENYYVEINKEKRKTFKSDKDKVNEERKEKIWKEVEVAYHPWEIVPDIGGISHRKIRYLPGFLRGIYWFGIPPFADLASAFD